MPLPEQDWSLEDIANPKVLNRNRLPTRAYALPPNKHLLNGNWDFTLAKSPINAPTPWAKDFDEEPWTKIIVPGHWQLQGHGEPKYANTATPFPYDPPFSTSKNPTATYRKLFYVPESFKDSENEYRLRFDGVDSAYHVFLNGMFVGYSQGSRNPAEFDISSLVSIDGENDLVVRVYQWSDGTYFEDQDMWYFSGIFRDVNLLAFPTNGYINHYVVRTLLDKQYKDAELTVDLDLVSSAAGSSTGKVSLELTDADYKPVVSKQFAAASSTFSGSLPLKSPHKWTAEDPYLYNLLIKYTVDDGHSYSISQKVGVRQVELISGKVCVNGTRIYFKGVDKHEHHKDHGRAVPFEAVKQDLINMKRTNVNAIRTSHYPNDPRMYDLCDELGIYVMDEADCETQAVVDFIRAPLREIDPNCDWFDLCNAVFSDNPVWRDAYVDRGTQMVLRDINHPSIIMWSLGNESLFGDNHRAMKTTFNKIDPTRLVHYEGDDEAEISDVYSAMYYPFEKLEKFAEEHSGPEEKALILCEYCYNLGTGAGSIVKYQEVMRKYPQLQGGFIWEWSNHGLTWKFPDGTVALANSGDFPLEDPKDAYYSYDGIVDSYHTIESPAVIELKKAYAPMLMSKSGTSKFTIKNVNDFEDLSFLALTYSIYTYSQTIPTSVNSKAQILVSSGTVELPVIKPQQEVSIDAPDFPELDGETWITWSFTTKYPTLWAPAGFEVAFYQFQLRETEAATAKTLSKLSNSSVFDSLSLTDEKGIVTLKARGTKLIYDKGDGKIVEWTSNGATKVVDGINCLTFWRDLENDFEVYGPEWKKFRMGEIHHTVRGVEVEKGCAATGVLLKIVEHSYYAPPVLGWGLKADVEYLVYLDSIEISYAIKPYANPFADSIKEVVLPKTLPRVGLELSLADSLDTTAWFGRGPLDSYTDRKEAQAIGIYNCAVDDMDVYNDRPQENGNRVDTRWVKLSTAHGGAGLGVTMKDRLFAFKVTNKDLTGAKHPFEIKKGPTVLRIDYDQQGLGSCLGADVEKGYVVEMKLIEFAITLKSLE